MIVVFLGPPGAGKGTQAAMVSRALSLTHISTGDIFRQNIKDGTELGLKVRQYTDAGRLVPDELTIALVEDRIQKPDCGYGVLLDGFPRTLPQAEIFAKHNTVDVVVDVEVPQEKLVNRLCGRRVCGKCGATTHISVVGENGKCPDCGEELIQRVDDSEKTVRDRLQVYQDQTFPLIDFYKQQGNLHIVDGDREVSDVYQDILTIMRRVKS